MGKWNNRLPGRVFRQQNPWRPPHVAYDTEPVPDNVPAWEKRFCHKIGSVPWRKIVNTKEFMSYYSNVVNWDDSAVEEAFHNAKKRFWAHINGFSCDIPLPDPDSFIDEIDWNPVIDSELMNELDRAYFAPDDERQGNENLCKKDKNSRSSTSAPDGNVNPWECYNAETSGITVSKEDGWNKWNNNASVPMNIDSNENSWQSNITQGERDTKDNVWGGQAKKSCEQDLMGSQSWDKSHSTKTNWDGNENPWDPGNLVSANSRKDEGWGSWNKAWGLNKHESNKIENVDDPWVCSSSQHQWQDIGREARGRKHWNPYSTQNRGFGIRRNGGNREVWNEDSQNRGGSYHNTSGYINSRFRGDETQTSWRGNNKRRVDFTCSP
ncbi:uncharacterized protein LOC133829821 [Humulus lupulus]|uniref:uncharacterized protein LOC133829821 n=1 Tax=Humulus lupulus TaxID=3486 RepID=UPI002B40F08B|nr:uncharacterized protein LOC133829821 [Humulus lupulus]